MARGLKILMVGMQRLRRTGYALAALALGLLWSGVAEAGPSELMRSALAKHAPRPSVTLRLPGQVLPPDPAKGRDDGSGTKGLEQAAEQVAGKHAGNVHELLETVGPGREFGRQVSEAAKRKKADEAVSGGVKTRSQKARSEEAKARLNGKANDNPGSRPGGS